VKLEQIEIGLIHPNKANPRRDVGNITELTASIKSKGFRGALIVAPAADDFGYTLVFGGHRRLEAAKKAKLKTIPCLIDDTLGGEAEQLEMMLIENVHRSDLSPVEEGDGYQHLLEFPDYDVTRIARATGRSARIITGRLQVAALPETTRDKVHNGQMTLTDAAKLAEFADEPAVVEHLAAHMGGYNFNYQLTAAKQRAKAMKAAAAAGAIVLADSDQLELSYPDARRLPYGTAPAEGLIMFFDPRYSYGVAYTTEPEPELAQGDDDGDERDDQGRRRGVDEVSTTTDAPRSNPNAGGSMVEKATMAAHFEELAAQEAERKTAAAVREEFIRTAVTDKRPRQAAVLNGLRAAFWPLAYQLEADLEFRELLGAPEPVASTENWPDLPEVEAAGRPVTDNMDLPNLVLVLTAWMLRANAVQALRDSDFTDLADLQAGVRYFDFLWSLGYDMSDVDTAQLEAIQARIAKITATEAADAESDAAELAAAAGES
jgi:ParB/RepB/Spo0J family partition protein